MAETLIDTAIEVVVGTLTATLGHGATVSDIDLSEELLRLGVCDVPDLHERMLRLFHQRQMQWKRVVDCGDEVYWYLFL